MFFGEALGVLPLGWFPGAIAPQTIGMPDPLFGLRYWLNQDQPQQETREDHLRQLRREIGLLPPEEEDDADEAVEAAVEQIIHAPKLPKTEAEAFRRVAKQQDRYVETYRRVSDASRKVIADSFKAEVVSRLKEVQNKVEIAKRLEVAAGEVETAMRAKVRIIQQDDDDLFEILAQHL